jgi:iron(III) transport system permease protein
MWIPENINIMRKASMRTLLALLAIIIINLPMAAIISKVNFRPDSNWEHFSQYLLPDAVTNTLTLVLFTLLLSGTIGVLLAAVVALFDFPFKKFFEWALFFPITIPPYIAAYVYAGMLSYTGIIQRLGRDWGLPLNPQWLDVMNMRGAVFIYSLTLYPYIYGAVKSYLENHSGNLIDTARVLGYNPLRLFTKVVLPLIRIPLIGGLMLVMMEVVSDYGVVKYFNIQAVSSVIFKSWFGMGEAGVAIRLSFYVMVCIIALQAIEEIMRGRKKYNLGSGRGKPITPRKLTGWKKYAVIGFILFMLSAAFLIPVGQMSVWAILAFHKVNLPNLSQIIFNTILYCVLATLIILVLNVWIAHSRRWMNIKSGFIISKLTQLGYSIPGAVIAVGTITLFVGLDSILHPLYRYFDPNAKKLLLSTSIAMLVFAFVVRYMAIGFNSVNSAFAKVGVKYNDAARTLGIGRTRAMLRIELPMLKNSLVAGFILTFIDIIKELPLTLLLRPFNFNTLASRAYEYANDERIHESSVPALLIIVLSMLLIALLVKISSTKGGHKKR